MSHQFSSQTASHYQAGLPGMVVQPDGWIMSRGQSPPPRSVHPTQYQHNRSLPQRSLGNGKENHPSACSYQAGPNKAQILQMGPAVLQDSMTSNVLQRDQHISNGEMASYPRSHGPTSTPVSSPGSDVFIPVAQRYTVPVLSYQNKPTIQDRGGNAASGHRAQSSSHESFGNTFGLQQVGVQCAPVAGSTRQPALDAHIGADVSRNAMEFMSSNSSHSFQHPQLSSIVRHPPNSETNASQTYSTVPCSPSSSEARPLVLSQMHNRSVHSGTFLHASLPASYDYPQQHSAQTEYAQYNSRLERLSNANEATPEILYRSDAAQTIISLDIGASSAGSDTDSSLEESGEDKTPTQKSVASGYALSIRQDERTGSTTPTQTRHSRNNNLSPTDVIRASLRRRAHQDSIVYATNSSNAVVQSVPQTEYAREVLYRSQQQSRVRSWNIEQMDTCLNDQSTDRRKPVAQAHSHLVADGRNDAPKNSTRSRSRSLNEHAAPFIPGQRTHYMPPNDDALDALNCGSNAHDIDINNVDMILTEILYEFMDLENLQLGLNLRGPIRVEDSKSSVHESVHAGFLPSLASGDAKRSAEGCINWLWNQQIAPAAVEYLSCYLAVSLCKSTRHLREFRSKHCLHLILLLFEDLKHDLIRKKMCACMFSASAQYARTVLEVDMPPGATGNRYNLVLDIALVQADIIGTLYRLGYLETNYIMDFLQSLIEFRPHPIRIQVIHGLLTAAGETICHPSNSRELGSLLSCMYRKYVMPPPGGSLPDVFLAPEEQKQAIFNRVRPFLEEIRMMICKWRLHNF
ncbi:hypothetical protein F5878DRAFT_605506 [Lentinula raphanica]|uniref:Uncharacterized protein n=1 Tax=Lentinula raphanica TaxID=153919 RepID=A0AA38UJJ4_9AGAR|nr:hypothetical protein F5878DRAFT_605506 [Lentinula raphanica]